MTDGVCPFAHQVTGVTNFDRGYVDRVGFCDHTAGGFYSTLIDPGFWQGAGVFVHFMIARDGRIAQGANIFDSPYAQGRLGPQVTWPPYDLMSRRNPNGYLISTEHEDAETVNGRTVFVPNAAWTPEQYAADLKVKRWCIEEVHRVTGKNLMRFGIDSLTGHHMFDGVNRAQCPGPAWRNEYRHQLYADLVQLPAEEEDDMLIKNPDGSPKQGWNNEGNRMVLYNSSIPVLFVGSEDGKYPGMIAKNYGGQLVYLRNEGQPDNKLTGEAWWSLEPGD